MSKKSTTHSSYDEYLKWKNGEETEEEQKISTHSSYDEYLKWKGDTPKEATKQTRQLSAPSPIMSATMKFNDPRSANYLDNLADTYAANAWYKRSPEAHASDARNYAATVGAAAKYDGMSYADRLAALEELKINLKNAPNPEQGAEYQYLKNNLAWANTSPEASHYRTQQAARQKNAAEEYIADAKKQTEQQNEAYNELDSEYGNSRYWQLAQYRGQAASRGEEDRVEQINQQIRDYADSIKGSREAELINLIEQPYDSEEIAAGSARAKAYSSGTQKKFDDANIILHADGDKSSLYTLALKGAGIASTGNEYEDYKRFVETLGGENRFPLYISDSDLNKVRDTIAGEYSPTTDSSNANYKQVSLEERAMYYALLGKGKKYEAADYINSLRNDLFQRAKSASAQRRAEKIKSEGPVVGTLDAAFQSVMSVPGQVLGGITSGLDLLGQYTTTGEYDPYKNPEMHLMQNEANEARGAVGQVLRDVTGGEVAPFIYNAVMSAVDSTAGALLGNELAPLASGAVTKSLAQNAYTFIMGSGAASQRAEELYLRGANNVQILYGSLTAGITEALFEEVSLDKLVHPEEYATKLLRILGQAGIEASEEMATDLANNIAGIALGDKSDIETEIRALLSENPNMTYEEAQRTAYGHAIEEIIESGLAGGLSGGLSAGAYDIANGVRYNRQNNKIGKNISSNYQAENTVKQGLEADENSEAYKLAKDIDERQKAGKTVSNKALGELARALDTELTEKSGNALEKASEYRREAAAAETVENALKENGATDEEAADLAPLVSKSILGEELTETEQAKIDNNTAAVRYMDEVGSKTSEISGETGLQQLALRVNATTRGTGSTKASDRLRESALDKVFETAMRNELKPAKLSDNEINKANETSYKVSTTGKTTYNGKAVNIDAIDEIGDGNALVTLDNGETAKLTEIEFADKGEAVAWQTITSIDGITLKAASELIAQYKNKPANVTAGVWARGIAEGYEIGRSGKLGTKEFPKAEASAKYLSNIGNDARRISETVGRQDARYEQHKEAIEVDRKNVNNKNVNDAADTLDKMGRKYKIVEGIDGDGYIEKDGTIVLNKEAKDPIGFVLKHELTHYAETSKDYDGFVKAVKGSRAFAAWIDKQSLTDGTQLQQEADYLRRLKDRYRRHGVTLTNTEAHREMIANFVGDTLFNENGVGLDGLVDGMNAADRNAVMRFLTKIADFFRKHFTKKGETAYLEHFFSQLQNTATGERADEKTYSIAETENDEKYLSAVNSDDMETAQRMVDEAAKAAGYTIKAYHGTPNKGFTVFNKSKIGSSTNKLISDLGFYFSNDEYVAKGYAQGRGEVKTVYISMKNPLLIEGEGWGSAVSQTDIRHSDIRRLIKEGNHDGAIISSADETIDINGNEEADTVYVVNNPSQIKSADPVTYDDNGNVIPLSERFNEGNEDIRWSIPETSEDVNTPEQKISSAKTSIKQVPALFNNPNVKFGKTNVDIGGGKYDLATQQLAANGTTNYVFDPFNRGEEENTATLDFVKESGGADTATCANVLNVIAERGARDNVILETAKAIKPDGTAYFMVYEGDGSGVGKETSSGWQNNRKTADYVAEISQYFEDVSRKGKLIIAENPIEDLPKAYWEVTPGKGVRYSIPETADELSREWVEKGRHYGTFDPGEKNTTGILTPQQVDDKTRVQRAERTILGDGTLPDDLIYELGKEVLLGHRSYTVESDEYAKEYIENATQQELEARVTKVLGNRNLQAGKLDVAAASYLIKQAIADDDTKKALEMEADLSAMLTHAGQFIQGWRLFKQMTPYGKLMSLQRAVRMTNEEVRLGGRKATIDENLAMLLLEAKTEKEQQEAADNITADVAAQLDSSWLEKWNAWRYMSMLINPRTHARNIIGNAIFVPAVYLKDIIATGFEKIPMFRNALNAENRHVVKVKKEYADFAKFFVKDANVERDLKSGWGSFNRGVALEKAVFKGKFESFRKSMMGLLEKEDMWFKNIHYKHAFASYLQAQRVDTKSLSTNLKQNSKDAQNLIMRAHEYAVSEAFKNTYNDANAFSKMMNDLGRKHAISRFLVDSVVPFRKTPANIVKRGVEYSPIGLLTSISKGAIDYARTEKVKKQYENGEISRAEYNKYMSTKGFDGNKFIEKLASGLTGTGIFLLGVLLRSMGVLHGRARDDKDKYLRQLGRQDYSAELFGGTFSIDWAAPMNLPLFMGVELMDLLADTKEGAPIGPSTFTKPMSQFLQPIINLSMLEGVQNAIESVSYSNEGEEVSDFTEAVAASYFTQAMPTFLGAVSRIADEKKRAYYTTNHASVDKFVQKVWNDFRAKIPAGYAIGGAIAKPPAIDVWGREISAGGMAQRIIENLVSPGYWKNVNYTDVDKEVLRVYDTTKDNSVIPSKPEKYIEISGEKKYLDEWEYCEYSVQKGTYSYGYIADALKNSKYNNLSDDQKAEVIKDLYSYAKAKAKDKVSDYDISSINTYKSAYKYEQSGGSVADFYIDKEKNK